MLKKENLHSYAYIDSQDFSTKAVLYADECSLAYFVSHKDDRIFSRLLEKCKEEGTLDEILNFKTYNHKMSLLHVIIDRGTLEMLRLFLMEKPEIDAKNIYGKTPLHLLIQGEHYDALEMLMCCHPDLNVPDKDKKTPLHYIVEKQDPKLLRRFLKAVQTYQLNLDLNAQDEQGKTPLHYAVNSESLENVLLLLKAGAKRDITNKHDITPMRLAILNEKLDFVEHMLPYYSSEELNERDYRGWNLLMEACRKGQKEIFKLLLKNPQTNIMLKDLRKMTILHHAAQGGTIPHFEIMEELLAHKNIHSIFLALNHEGKTAYECCRHPAMKKIFNKYMKEKGILITQNEEEVPVTKNEIHFAVLKGKPKVLIEKLDGASEELVNQQDEKGRTPLDYAFVYAKNTQQTELLKTLISHKAVKMNSRLFTADDLYNLGIYLKDYELLEMLIMERALPLSGKEKVRIWKKDWHYHPFHGMIALSDTSTKTKELVSAFMQLNHSTNLFFRKNSQGDSSLHLAIRKGNPECVRVILEKSDAQDVNEPGKWGETPLAIALSVKEVNQEIVELLLEQEKLDIFAWDIDKRPYIAIAKGQNLPEPIIQAIKSRMDKDSREDLEPEPKKLPYTVSEQTVSSKGEKGKTEQRIVSFQAQELSKKQEKKI